MANPSKPLALVQGHRTKAELEARAEGEKALTTSVKMEPPEGAAKNKEAYAHWTRVREVLAGVGLDEAFYEHVVWRYCVLLAEYDELAGERQRRADDLEQLRAREGEMEARQYYKALEALGKALDATERKAAKKRDQLLAIEKENLMTVQGKLRAIPKRPEEKKLSPMEEFMRGRREWREGGLPHDTGGAERPRKP